MKLLVSAFEFPPLASAGVRRPLGFVNYLPEFGISPIVVTTDRESYVDLDLEPFDDSLLSSLSSFVSIERISCQKQIHGYFRGRWNRFAGYFRVLEQRFGPDWEKPLLSVVETLVRERRPDAIYATMPPFFMGPLWCKLSKRFSIPLVLDFRDAWSQWRVLPYKSWLHYYATLRLERKCLQQADHIVTTSPQTRLDLLQVHKCISPDKISVVYNGYDNEYSAGLDDSTGPDKSLFTIGYVGGFYYSPDGRETMMAPWWKKRVRHMIQYVPRKEDWLYRSPYFFFRAINQLFLACPELRQRVRIKFAGTKPPWIDDQINEFGLQGVVEFVGRLHHAAVLKFQKQCDALLITSSKIVGGADYSIASKTFEYFMLEKPIIAFVAEGAQKVILTESGLSVDCDPDDPQNAAEQLAKLIYREKTVSIDRDYVGRFHRRECTAQLARIVRSTVLRYRP